MSSDDDVELPYWSRTYCGYHERFVQPFVLQLGDSSPLSLGQAAVASQAHAEEARASSDGSGTGSTVWDAGIVLAAYVLREGTRERVGAGRCLDLGSGTGIVGLAAAASGAFSHVVLSDLASVVSLTEQNARRNAVALPSGCEVRVVSMLWEREAARSLAQADGPFDVILGGDLLYRPQVVAPLLCALDALVVRRTTVLIAASMQHSPETIRARRRSKVPCRRARAAPRLKRSAASSAASSAAQRLP